jgi:hypothetical protein
MREGFEIDDEIFTVFERFEVVWPLDVGGQGQIALIRSRDTVRHQRLVRKGATRISAAELSKDTHLRIINNSCSSISNNWGA